MKQHPPKGHATKHAGTHKHAHAGKKHHPAKPHAAHGGKAHHPKAHVVAKHPHHAKPRGAPRGTLEARPPSLHDLPCCAAAAVAASLALTRHGPVSDSAVLALHRAAGGTDSAAATIGEALLAACARGADGVMPARIRQADPAGPYLPGMILGAELPGAHAVTVAPDGCWLSWGEHHDPGEFPDAVVEEAWAVTWP